MIVRFLLIAVFSVIATQAFAESPSQATLSEPVQAYYDQSQAVQSSYERPSVFVGVGHWVKDVYVEIIHRDWKRNNCWPKPFDCPDRYAVRQPFGVMVRNGWERQNMLGNHHFIDQTGKLSDAGRLKVRWIITQVPLQYRAVYIHRAFDAEETAARIDAVQQFAMQAVPNGELPPILETDAPFPGWPSGEINAILQKYRETTPTPRLPERSSSSDADAS